MIFFIGVGGVMVCTRWVGLRVTVKEMIIESYLDVVKNIFPLDNS